MLLRAYSISMNAKMTPEQRSARQHSYASCHERTTLCIICIRAISRTNAHSQWKIKEKILLKSHQETQARWTEFTSLQWPFNLVSAI